MTMAIERLAMIVRVYKVDVEDPLTMNKCHIIRQSLLESFTFEATNNLKIFF